MVFDDLAATEDGAPSPTTASQEQITEIVGADVTVAGIEVGLPVGADADLTALPDGSPLLVGDDGVVVAPLEKEDGSVQIVFVIDGNDSPGEFEFPFEVIDGAVLQVMEDGSAVYTGADGGLLLASAAPWAIDASGHEVPTHFEARGSTLVQVVEHAGAPVDYPVVADPWLGVDLFSKVWTDTYNGQLRVNARKSAWGQGMHTPTVAGQAIFLNAGWSEVKAKAPSVTVKTTLHQQYQCHVAGGYANLAGDWNLERFRVNRTTHWSYGVAVHRCNWTTANRY
ncbi:hypothetical protein [Actinotalea sp. K2]|uniref:hypothetical protein n=1 Tax=Actinotalea sp. K2 TaxID=2939438 RepID=UPI00201764C0|nr:hypothetical protein [Actinotalea sp. K2]MCL3860819.1 hypothetical protein [Actinotalea sp. K2]